MMPMMIISWNAKSLIHYGVEITKYYWNFMVVQNQHENKKGDQFQGFGVECQPFIKSEEDIMGRRRVPGMAGTPTG